MPVELTDFGFGKWLTMPISGLVFPASCCRCGTSTRATSDFAGGSRTSALGMLGQLGAVERRVIVPVPFCVECDRRHRRRRVIGLVAGIVVGALLAAGMVATFPFHNLFTGQSELIARAVVLCVALALGAWTGLSFAGRNDPVRLRNYSAAEQTVQVWFESNKYRAQVAELLAERDDVENENQ